MCMSDQQQSTGHWQATKPESYVRTSHGFFAGQDDTSRIAAGHALADFQTKAACPRSAVCRWP